MPESSLQRGFDAVSGYGRGDYETAERGICPACGATSADRAGGEPGGKPGHSPGGVHSDARSGEEHGNGPSENVKWFHYIPLAEWEEWEKIGWKISSVGAPHHDQYSVMGEWGGEGVAVRPMMAMVGKERRVPSFASSLAAQRDKDQPLPPSKSTAGSSRRRPPKRRKPASKA